MSPQLNECIRKYINDEYKNGGLIGISDLAEYCDISAGKILVALIELKKAGEVEIIKRYFCPEAHPMSIDNVPFCQVCDYKYSEDFITTLIYIKPLKANQN